MKDVLERAAKTFVEALIPALIVGFTVLDFSDPETALKSYLTVVGIPAVATAISAAWNVIDNYIFKDKETATESDPEPETEEEVEEVVEEEVIDEDPIIEADPADFMG